MGWSGYADGVPLLQSSDVLLTSLSRCDDDLSLCSSNADCDGAACTSTCDLPGGHCELTGPNVRTRCLRDFDICDSNADCGGASCERITSPPIPLSASNTPACVVMFAEGDITGTYDPGSGDSTLAATLRWRISLGEEADRPCPRCGIPAEHPQVGDEFTCEGGERSGQACSVDAVNSIFGGVRTTALRL